MVINPASNLWSGSTFGVELLDDTLVVLLLLVGGVLVYRFVKQRYLLTLFLGWSAYLAYRVLERATLLFASAPPILSVAADLAFALCISLFVAAVVLYTRNRARLLPLTVVAAVLFNIILLVGLFWPEAWYLLQAAHFALAVMSSAGAWLVVRFNSKRRELWPWLLAAMLVVAPLERIVTGELATVAARLCTEVLFGVGVLLLILDETRMRHWQVTAGAAIAKVASEARDTGEMIPAMLEEFRRITGSRAAWFRSFEDQKAVLTHSVGLSDQFVLVRRVLALDSGYGTQIGQLSRAAVLQSARADGVTRSDLEREGFDHVLLIPVRGRSAVLGVLCLGSATARSYTSEEIRFFSAIADQAGDGIKRLRLLEAVMRSQRDWVSVIDSLNDMVFVHDQNFRVIKLNRAMQRKVGRPYQELVGRPCDEVLPRSAGVNWSECPYCGTGTQALDPCFGGKAVISTSSYKDRLSQVPVTVHVLHDASDRYAAEERYRLLFDQVQEGVFTSTPEGRLLDCNNAFARMLGYEERQELFRLDIARDLYAAPWQRERYCREIAENNFVRNYEIVLRRKDGSLLMALESSFAVRGREGETESYQGFLLDVSENKRAEEEIRRRNRELQAVNAIAIVATQSFDLDEVMTGALALTVDLFSADIAAIYLRDSGALTFRRRAAYGFRSETVLRQVQTELPGVLLDGMQREGPDVITSREPAPASPEFSKMIVEESMKSWMWAVLRARDKVVGALVIGWRTEREVAPTDQNMVIAISRQLATSLERIRLYEETRRAYEDLRTAQEQLLQSEKMSAVGQLVSGVAHELNNPLTAILGYAQLLEGEDLDERCRDYVSKLQRQAQRTQRLVQNLLSFARSHKSSKALVDLRQIVEDTLALRDYDLRLHDIQVEREFEPDLPAVFADAHQLEQVFLNIINNAVDAMLQVSKGGKLRVRIAHQRQRVLIEFRDSGPGLKEPQRVFDPFYTTKPPGKGTGLGLSICYGILKEHGGEIIASNHSEGGAQFQIFLAGETRFKTSSTSPIDVPSHSLQNCKILIVDDEEAILDTEQQALTAVGAEVVTFSDPQRALEEVQRHHFDAILLDCTMTDGWTAPRIYSWLKEHRPGSERTIILCSSNADDPSIRNFAQQNQVQCLAKPFSSKQLVETLQTHLTNLRPAASARR